LLVLLPTIVRLPVARHSLLPTGLRVPGSLLLLIPLLVLLLTIGRLVITRHSLLGLSPCSGLGLLPGTCLSRGLLGAGDVSGGLLLVEGLLGTAGVRGGGGAGHQVGVVERPDQEDPGENRDRQVGAYGEEVLEGAGEVEVAVGHKAHDERDDAEERTDTQFDDRHHHDAEGTRRTVRCGQHERHSGQDQRNGAGTDHAAADVREPGRCIGSRPTEDVDQCAEQDCCRGAEERPSGRLPQPLNGFVIQERFPSAGYFLSRRWKLYISVVWLGKSGERVSTRPKPDHHSTCRPCPCFRRRPDGHAAPWGAARNPRLPDLTLCG